MQWATAEKPITEAPQLPWNAGLSGPIENLIVKCTSMKIPL